MYTLQDFLSNDDPFPMPPQVSTSTAASTCSNSTTAVDSERGLTFVAGHGRGNNPSLITGASLCETAASSKSSRSSQSDSDCSPSTKTLEKLRSFKFVKTSNLKSRSVHPKRPLTSDNQSDLTPPPNKRRSISDDDTNCDSPSDSGARSGNTQSGPTFKQPSFNPRTSFNSLSYTPASFQSEGQCLRVSANVTSTLLQRHTPGGTGSIVNFKATQPSCHQSNMSDPTAPSTPILSNTVPHTSAYVRGGILSTPHCTPNSSQPNATLTTPQRSVADTPMRTPTRARQTTPLVSTPIGSGVTTPIARLSVLLKRKFPGPAGLLPLLVCTCGKVSVILQTHDLWIYIS